MARIVLSEAGAAAGARFLPGGLNLFGRTLGGAAIGRAAGAIAGNAIDAALFSPGREGPRLKAIHLTESREGAGIPNVYGRARVGGQVIWAARFRETRREDTAGKGGPSVSSYRYSLSFAVAICEGEIQRVDRIWANGEPLTLKDINHRIYRGSEDQEPDPLIEAVEGEGQVPGYRAIAYIVFEDLSLERFGNRVPQFSFEVLKAPPARGSHGGPREHVTGVNIIPASGEFVYATEVISTRQFPGRESPINANTHDGRADFLVSLDQLVDAFPNLRSAALTVGWFGSDLRAEHCLVRPGIETREKETVPWKWEVCSTRRADAFLVSGATDGEPNYGGTPADRAVIQAIEALKAAQINVTVSPFLFMDVPPGNGLPDPYGADEQAAFPWRGRITSLADGSALAGDAVSAFMGQVQPDDFALDGGLVAYSGAHDDWGYRRFALHMAMLARAAGGVEAVLLGSELRGLTRLRDAAGNYPFVDALVQLASDVRAIVGPATKISYAADWTEYGAHLPGDGSQDVNFPLDPLWAHGDIDFVGIDWYPPMGDWRDGDGHLDALAGFHAPDDADYLAANIAGGEAHDWYYSDLAARDAQERTPIIDTAHGENWIFRAKDIDNWWSQPHHARPGGVRNASPTAWVAGSKPVRLSEIGFPAVDKGGNSPNLFFDPKSSESALPPYSSGARDDVFQARALASVLGHFATSTAVEEALVWAWDGRPFPAWPARSDLWSDGANWQRGHWLNGRTGLAPLADLVCDLAQRAGLEEIDCSGVNGLVEGYVLDGVHSLRAAIEPFATASMLQAGEREGVLTFTTSDTARQVEWPGARLAEPGLSVSRALMDKSPGRVQLAYGDLQHDYLPAIAQARRPGGDPRNTRLVELPLSLSPAQAEQIARDLLERSQTQETAAISTGPEGLQIGPGDRLHLGDGGAVWQVESGEFSDGTYRFALSQARAGPPPRRAGALASPGIPAVRPAPVELVVIDAPYLQRAGNDPRPLLAAAADPWPGPVDVHAGVSAETLDWRARIDTPALIGRLSEPLAPGPVGRWDRAATIAVEMSQAGLASADRLAVLGGQNGLLVQTGSGWEHVGFRNAELTGARDYRLDGLLRGLGGSDLAAASGAPAGAIVVFVDRALVRAEFSAQEMATELIWRAGNGAHEWRATHHDVQGLPWMPAQLVAATSGAGGGQLTWLPRGPRYHDNWELPEPAGVEIFEVEWRMAGLVSATETVNARAASLPVDADAVRVRQVGEDGRAGPWTSILQIDR